MPMKWRNFGAIFTLPVAVAGMKKLPFIER
jgi:hypothetical protein